jgi:hypothetical protein
MQGNAPFEVKKHDVSISLVSDKILDACFPVKKLLVIADLKGNATNKNLLCCILPPSLAGCSSMQISQLWQEKKINCSL